MTAEINGGNKRNMQKIITYLLALPEAVHIAIIMVATPILSFAGSFLLFLLFFIFSEENVQNALFLASWIAIISTVIVFIVIIFMLLIWWRA